MRKVLDAVARCTAPKELPDDIFGTRNRTQAFARARVAQKLSEAPEGALLPRRSRLLMHCNSLSSAKVVGDVKSRQRYQDTFAAMEEKTVHHDSTTSWEAEMAVLVVKKKKPEGSKHPAWKKVMAMYVE